MTNCAYQNTLNSAIRLLNDWNFDQDQIDNIGKSIDSDKREVYPNPELVLRCFYNLSPMDVKVIILGQDCYHTPGVADGLAFSTKNNNLPPSLRNIFKELKDDLGIENTSGNLYNWKKQGVLLLNTYLTVARGQPNSHANIWKGFSESVIINLATRCLENNEKKIFILWGNYAQKCFYDSVKNPYNVEKIISAHPSPFSADKGFFGSKPFSKTNKFLKDNDIPEIDWRT